MASLKQILKLVGGSMVREGLAFTITVKGQSFSFRERDCRLNILDCICKSLSESLGVRINSPCAIDFGFSIGNLVEAGWLHAVEEIVCDPKTITYDDWVNEMEGDVITISGLKPRAREGAIKALLAEGYVLSGDSMVKGQAGVPDLSAIITREDIIQASIEVRAPLEEGKSMGERLEILFKKGLLGAASADEKDEFYFAGQKSMFSRKDIKAISTLVPEGFYTFDSIAAKMHEGVLGRFGDRLDASKMEELTIGLIVRLAGQIRLTDGGIEYRLVWKN